MVDKRDANTLNRVILNNIEPGTTIVADMWRGYISRVPIHTQMQRGTQDFFEGGLKTCEQGAQFWFPSLFSQQAGLAFS